MTITVNGPSGISINFPEGTDAATIEAVMQQATGGAAPKQQMVGFGERSQREQDMPLDQEAQDELAIAKQMAVERQMPFNSQTGATGAFLGGARQGLSDEISGVAGAIGSTLKGDGPARGYHIGKEVSKRLAQEFADKHPTASTLLDVAGGFVSAPPLRQSALGGVGQAIKDSLTAGAAVGGLQGFGYGEGLAGSLGGAALGASVGGALGAAVPAAIAGAGKLSTGLRNAYRAATDTADEAYRRVGQAFERDANSGGLMDEKAYQAAVDAGVPITPADRGGEATRRLARSAADQSPEAAQILDNVVSPRAALQVERVDDVLRRQSQLATPAEGFMEAAEAAARKANGPAYQRAMALGSGSVWDNVLEQLVDAPAMQTALKNAIKKSADNAVIDGFGAMNPRVGLDPAGNVVFRDAKGIPAYPDLRLWDLTKRELDRMGRMAERAGDSDARIYKTLAQRLVEHLDSMGDMGRAYKTARQTAASFFGAQNAFEAGLKYATAKGMQAREAMKAIAKLKPQERALFREGYIEGKRTALSELKTNRDAMLSVMNSPAEIERTRVALGKNGVKELQATLEIERAMQALKKEVQGNSKTNRYQQDLMLASATGGGAVAGGFIGDQDPTSITIGGALGAMGKFGQRAITEKLSREIAKVLVSGDPAKIKAITKLAARSTKYLEAVRSLNKGLSAQLGSTVSSGVQ